MQDLIQRNKNQNIKIVALFYCEDVMYINDILFSTNSRFCSQWWSMVSEIKKYLGA